MLHRMKEKEMHPISSIVKQKMAYAGLVLRGSSGDKALQVLEGKIEDKLYNKEDTDVCGEIIWRNGLNL